MLQAKAGVRVDTADTLDEAAEKLSENDYDLVLVNRELAVDGSLGLDLIGWMKEQKLSTAGDAGQRFAGSAGEGGGAGCGGGVWQIAH